MNKKPLLISCIVIILIANIICISAYQVKRINTTEDVDDIGPPNDTFSAQYDPVKEGYIIDAPWKIESGNDVFPLLTIADDSIQLYPDIRNIYVCDYNKYPSCNVFSEVTNWASAQEITSSNTPYFYTFYLNKNNFKKVNDSIAIRVKFDLDAWWLLDNWEGPIYINISSEILPKIEKWYCGDTHYHTEFTDTNFGLYGEFGAPIDTTTKAGEVMGLDWITGTDHSNSFREHQGDRHSWENFTQYCNNNPKCLIGTELNCDYWYVGGGNHLLAYDYSNFIDDNFQGILSPNNPTCEEMVSNVNNQGGFTYAAHPEMQSDPFGMIIDKLHNYSLDYKGLEIWNGDINNPTNREALNNGVLKWKSLLLKGRKIFISAGSDAHGDLNGGFGKEYTCCYAPSFSKSNIFDALENGNCYMGNNGALTFHIYGGKLGNTKTLPEGANVELDIDYNLVNDCTLKVLRGEIGGSENQLWSVLLISGSQKSKTWIDSPTQGYYYYRLECTSPDGKDRIYTNPIWVNITEDACNPNNDCCDFLGKIIPAGEQPDNPNMYDGIRCIDNNRTNIDFDCTGLDFFTVNREDTFIESCNSDEMCTPTGCLDVDPSNFQYFSVSASNPYCGVGCLKYNYTINLPSSLPNGIVFDSNFNQSTTHIRLLDMDGSKIDMTTYDICTVGSLFPLCYPNSFGQVSYNGTILNRSSCFNSLTGTTICWKSLNNVALKGPKCIPNITNTSWSEWTNISCLPTEFMNQSRFRTQYDSSDCETFDNETIFEFRATEFCCYTLVSPGGWYNPKLTDENCYWDDTVSEGNGYWNAETQQCWTTPHNLQGGKLPFYSCCFGTQQVDCKNTSLVLGPYLDSPYCGNKVCQLGEDKTNCPIDCCTPNITNTSWSEWTNISCLISDKMNQTRSRIEYDSNSCGEVENVTITEFRAIEYCDYCTPNIINTPWSDWTNISGCNENGKIMQSRFLIQYDSNNCQEIANETIYEYREIYSKECMNICQVYSPTEDAIYPERRILFNISADEKLQRIEYRDYSDRRQRWRRLCVRCDKYEREKSFRNGEHNVSVRCTTYENEEEYHDIAFFNDYKDPRISKTHPIRGYTNGYFEVEFKEENPAELWLNYKNKADAKSAKVNLGNCWDERSRRKCGVSVNLTEFNSQEITYWFNITDIAGNYDESRKRDLDVDTVPPKINNPKDMLDRVYRNYAYLKINITEKNLDKVEYYDNNDDRPKWRRACSRLKDGICEKKVRFDGITPKITIRVLDEAGNTDYGWIE